MLLLNRSRKLPLAVLGLAFAAAFSPCPAFAAADAGQPDFSAVRKLIQERMAAESTPSIALAVARGGRIQGLP